MFKSKQKFKHWKCDKILICLINILLKSVHQILSPPNSVSTKSNNCELSKCHASVDHDYLSLLTIKQFRDDDCPKSGKSTNTEIIQLYFQVFKPKSIHYFLGKNLPQFSSLDYPDKTDSRDLFFNYQPTAERHFCSIIFPPLSSLNFYTT